MDREEFYDAQIESWPTHYIEIVCVFLFNEKWQIILQKRSNTKRHNPDLLDKSIGWHVKSGDGIHYTAMIESIQELQVPSLVAQNADEFTKIYEEMSPYLWTCAILEYVEAVDDILPKMIWGELIDIGDRSHVYFGIYSGPLRNADSEAKWILYFTLDELESALEKSPDDFTQDVAIYMKKYGKHMRAFLAKL